MKSISVTLNIINSFSPEPQIPEYPISELEGTETSPLTFEQELEIGTEVEKEHTSNLEEAAQIARTHLEENPHYYSEAIECELITEEIPLQMYEKFLNQ